MTTLKPVLITILLADDSDTDRLFTRDALDQCVLATDLREVENGEELMDYLNRAGNYEDPAASPHAHLILLDLNMPRKSGVEALQEIKANPMLRRIPVIMLTTSGEEDDIALCYDLGVNSYIKKPVTFSELVRVMRSFCDYWGNIVAIPRIGER